MKRVLVVWVLAVSAACAAPEALRVAVADPLAAENACACVAGYAQRDYHALGKALARRLGRPVEVGFASSIGQARERMGGEPHVMIGKASVVEAELRRGGHPAGACLARLTDRRGETVFQGALVVRGDDPARRVADVAGYRVVFGGEDCDEKYAAALELLRAFGVGVAGTPETADNCTLAAGLVSEGAAVDGRRVAAFVSDYALPLLTACGTVDEGALRVVGRTGPVPFVAAYATRQLGAADAAAVRAALLRVSGASRLRRALESRDGFVPPEALPQEAGVPGPAALPQTLPGQARVRWRRGLAAQGLGGLAVEGRYLVVSDKNAAQTEDVWRCLDAATGEPVWTLAYPAAGEMDYTGSPRATSVVAEGRVYLLGAFGELVCAELATGKVVWRQNLVKRYGGKVPVWGFCGTPLVVGGRVMVQAAGAKASLVALDAGTGREVWRARGEGPGYGSLIHAYLGGRWQVVGHESAGLCGWNPADGRRLWRVVPPEPHDFNVPTPLRMGDLLVAATENNGVRFYAFGADGAVCPEPVMRSDALSPQMATPVRVGNRLWGQDDGVVTALEVGREVRVCGEWHDPAFAEYATLLAGAGRVLVVAQTGEVFLFRAEAEQGETPARMRVFGERADGLGTEVWSYPAVAGGSLYLRSQDEVVCVSLGCE